MSIAGYRLSPQQKHIWQLRGPGPDSAYISQVRIDIHGPVEPQRMEAALNALVARFEILRTGYQLPVGLNLPVQVIAETAAIPLAIHDLRQQAPEVQAARLADLAADQRRPFELESPPLLRALLACLADSSYTLSMALPSFSADAATLDLLAARLAQAYAGALEPGEDELQYADLAEWLNETLEDEDSQTQVETWYGQIVAAPIAVALPFERVPEDPVEFYPRRISRSLDGPARSRLEALAEAHGATPEALYLAVFQAFVHRLTAQEEFVIGLGCHGRTYEELEGAPGLFARFLPLAARIEGGMSLADCLADLGAAIETAFDAQEYFSWDVAASAGGDSPLPFFALNFEYLPEGPAFNEAGLDWQVAARRALPDRFNLKVTVWPEGDELGVGLNYDSVLFDGADAEAMADHFVNLLSGLAEAPDAPFGTVDITTEEERSLLFEDFLHSELPPAPDATVVALIDEQATRNPDRPAVIFQGQALSYAALTRRAAALARRLQTLGLGPGKFAGLYAENSHAMFVGMLAILKTGGAYLPLDPAYPQERLTFMLEDSGAGVLLAQTQFIEELKTSVPAGVRVVALDSAEEAVGQLTQTSGPAPNDFAYLIYTSGSTGKPKGVPIRHRNLAHSLHARRVYYEQPARRYLLLSSFGFDSSVAGIFWALATGGALVLPEPGMARDPQYVADLVFSQGVTHTLMLPALYNLLLDQDPARLASLETVIVAGEACPPRLVTKHFERLPGAALYNEYGPTEGTVWATVHHMTGREVGLVPIGKPIPGARVYLLNEFLQPAPLGSPGELVIGGPGVAAGYLNRPEETGKRFIEVKQLTGGRLYRTGDLASWRRDGSLQFLGRADSQVKIRGYRVEPGEIEALLVGHPAVRSAAVVMREDSPGDQRLVAYVVAGDSGAVQPEVLREYLAAQLPAYMVPAVFVALAQLPLTPSGKVDRKRLPAPDRGRRTSGTAYEAPGSAVEKLLAGVWAEVLDLEKVGLRDNFFELGGHSILVTQLVARLREALPVELPLRTIFDHPSVGGLAEALLWGEDRGEIERTAELTLKVMEMSEGEVDALLDE